MMGLQTFTMAARPSMDASDSARLTKDAEISVSTVVAFARISLICCESYGTISSCGGSQYLVHPQRQICSA